MTTGMGLRVVIVEDRPDDAELLAYGLKQAGFEPAWCRVESAAEFVTALAEDPDIVLADYSLPQFGAVEALTLARRCASEVPVIVVSGQMDEETCVESLRLGAADYLLKDRLGRLGAAVEQAIARSRMRRVADRAERQARESEGRFRAAFDQAPIGMAVTRTDGQVEEVNAALAGSLGRTPDQLAGTEFDLLVHPDDRAALAAHTDDLLAGAATEPTIELRLVDDDGRASWTLYSAAVVHDGGCERRLIRQMQDIGGRRRAEADLRRTMQILRGLVDNSPAALYLRDAEGQFLLVNGAFEALAGITRDELGRRDAECWNRRQVVTAEESFPDGRTYLSVRYPLLDQSGEPYAVGAIYTDISEQKRVHAELSELDRM